MLFTADHYQRTSTLTIHEAIVLTADVHAPAREWAAEHGYDPLDDQAHFTIGYLRGTILSLLDALGFPEQGPNIDQHSWLPDDDSEEE